MGAAKAVKATAKGLTGVFRHLMQEHGEVSALMKRVSMSSDAQVRREHYPKIREELISHERAEVRVVYSELGALQQTRDVAAKHNREAKELESAIADLDAIDPANSEWGPAFEQLVQLVTAHVTEEESDFFPKAQDVIGEDEAKALLGRYETAKKNVKTELAAEPAPAAS